MTIKIKTINNQHAEAISGNRASYAHALSPVDVGDPNRGPRFHECDNKQTKKLFCYLNLPVTLISGIKMVAW